jgi:hypothetical protein
MQRLWLVLCVAACSSPTSSTPDATGPGEFGAICNAPADCTGGRVCVFRVSGGAGFCSSACDSVGQCPSNYDCQTINNEARKFCVPEDHLMTCKNSCSDYDAGSCLLSGALSKCIAGCDAATVTMRKAFESCSLTAIDTCDTSCIDTLAPGMGPFGKPGTCQRMAVNDTMCLSMGAPPAAYTCTHGVMPTQTGCSATFFPDQFCCPH